MARTLSLFALAAALVAPAWLSIESRSPAFAEVAAMLALALLPTLAVARGAGRRVVALAFAAATAVAAASAFDIPLSNARPGDRDRDFLDPVLAAGLDGVRDFWETGMPFDGVRHWQMGGLVLLAIFAFVGATGALVAARRPVAAASALLVGVAWPATMAARWVPDSRPLATGALTLLAFLAFLFLLGRQRHRLRGAAQAAAFGGVLVVAAVAGGTSEAVAKPAFLGWDRWDLYDRPAAPVSVSYVWDSNYGGISFPEKPTVVLKVRVPETARSLYWRATTLDKYHGYGWSEQLAVGAREPAKEIDVAANDPLLPDAARDPKNWIRQDVTVVALDDNHLVGSAQPVKWEPGTDRTVQVAENGVVFMPDSLERGQRYTVWSYAPRVSAEQLAPVRGNYPEELDPYLEVSWEVMPEFGAPNRDATVRRLFERREWDPTFAEHGRLYRTAQEVVGNAKTPYEAAVALEAWLRSKGGFVYDEKPPLGGAPILSFFVHESKRGYCQYFAGAMAVMLRLLGVPARVAAGFTSGKFDEGDKEWTVADRNAHTWVEVYFPGFGWLPFDPTPARGSLSAPYSAVSPEFDTSAAAGLFSSDVLAQIDLDELQRRSRAGLQEGAGLADSGRQGAEGAAGAGRTVFGPALLVLSLAVLALLALKAVHRGFRLATRDPRAVAAACRRDLVGFLLDQRLQVPASATLADLGEMVERAFAVDAHTFVRTVTAARFGPPREGARAARRARHELRVLRRRLKGEMTLASRARGALSLRSLTA